MTFEHLQDNAAEELRQGLSTLAAAEKLLADGFEHDAVSRAYYAAFHFARVLAWAVGEKPKTHRGVAHLLRLHWVETGRLPDDTPALFASLADFRHEADYGVAATIEREKALQVVADARRLIDRMGALLAELGIWRPTAEP
ncbi:MAG: HEPN domain-containing protein [Deltaproteobacteria bacterium]